MTAIEWTDATWNPTTGCDRVSPGCANCYALTLAARLKAMGQPGYQADGDPRTSGPGFALTLHPDKLEQPLRWRKPRRVFVNSMSDLFHEDVPAAFITAVFDTMEKAPQHSFQVLTKRPEIALGWARDEWCDRLPANVWLGVSIENARYTWRAEVLRQIPAAVRFISAEPLLGSLYPQLCMINGCRLDAGHAGKHYPLDERAPGTRRALDLSGISWLIVGGESGPGYRPMQIEHARELRDACAQHGVAFFFKQHGGQTPKSGGKTLDGREWCDYPVAA